MAAYMQFARRTDLPSSLRPLQGKHLKMLTARQGDILGALDDDGLRAMLLDWLADKPPGISKPDAAVLAIAATRDETWEEQLASKAPKPRHGAAPKKDPSAAIDREKERTRKAREEARKTKEESEREVAKERSVVNELRSEVAVLKQKVGTLEKSLSAATRERERMDGELDRELRKARRRAEKAEGALEDAKSELRSLRSSTSAKPVASPKKKAASAPKASPSEPTRRQRLGVPKGRYADAPETLTEWLSTPHVHLLIDGYNVSKAEGGFGDLRLETQRERLLQEVGKIARRHKVKATVIFDGSDIAPGTSRRARGPVEVEYSRSEEIADDHLIAKLEGLPKNPVVVATNDRELQGRAARLGATIATSNQLLALIR
jgi:predicted RNA-binding protein with PIN domain